MSNDIVPLDKPKVGRPTLYRDEFCDIVIECGREGMSRAEICAVLDINHDTFYDWLKRHEPFRDAATRAKELEYAWWLGVGRKHQFNRNWNSNGWALQMRNRFGNRFAIDGTNVDELAADELTHDTGKQLDDIRDKLARAIDAATASNVSGQPNAREPANAEVHVDVVGEA